MIIQKLVIAFVMIIIGLAFVGQISTLTTDVTLRSTATDTVDISSARLAGSGTVINEIAFLNNTRYTLSNYSLTGGFVGTIVLVQNRTDGTDIPETNYTYASGVIYNSTKVSYDNVSINYTYTYSYINGSVKIPTSSFMTYRPSRNYLTDLSDCVITTSEVVFKNESGSVQPSTAYTFNSDGSGTIGSLQVKNVVSLNGTTSNTTSIVYNYCPTDYVSSWGGTILNLVPGFFALALLAIGVGLFYGVARESNIL